MVNFTDFSAKLELMIDRFGNLAIDHMSLHTKPEDLTKIGRASAAWLQEALAAL